ncbi:MAG: exonuclease domain-containing protein, partial [Legionella sp.]
HNAWFDLLFMKEAINRSKVKSPFHAFTCFDTATLGGFVYGQTVLAKAAQAAKIAFDPKEAHSAIYDAEKTADLFCTMLNTWRELVL